MADEQDVGEAQRVAADAELQAAVGRGVLSLGDYEDLSGAVWAARTRGELAAATAGVALRPEPVPVAPAPVTGSPLRTVAVLSTSGFSGAVTAGQPVHGTAVLGSVVLDLRRTDLPDRVTVRATTVLGETTVLVPRGVGVHLTGAAVLGTRTTEVAPAEPGAPVVTVRGTAVLGTVTVSHGDAEDAPADRPAGHPGVARSRRSGGLPVNAIVSVVAAAAVAYGAVQVAGAETTRVFSSGTTTLTDGGTVDVGLLFGSQVVVVPDDARVTTNGGMIFGSMQCDAACLPSNTGPVITVDGAGAFGSVEILTEREHAAEQDDD